MNEEPAPRSARWKWSIAWAGVRLGDAIATWQQRERTAFAEDIKGWCAGVKQPLPETVYSLCAMIRPLRSSPPRFRLHVRNAPFEMDGRAAVAQSFAKEQ